MTDEPDNDLQNLWQAQSVESTPMSIKYIHQDAESYQSKIFWRNTREYVAVVFVIIFFGWSATRHPEPLRLWGYGLIVAGSLFFAGYLHLRGRADTKGLAVDNCLDFHRKALIRQRDLMRSVWWWGILPLMPGMATVMYAASQHGLSHHPVKYWVTVGIMVFMLAVMIFINHNAANRLQKKIDILGD